MAQVKCEIKAGSIIYGTDQARKINKILKIIPGAEYSQKTKFTYGEFHVANSLTVFQ